MPLTTPEDDLTRGECVEACPKCAPTVPQQPDVRECGCRLLPFRASAVPYLCALHAAFTAAEAELGNTCAAHDILVRALFAVAGSVAAGASPADAVADVRKRFGI